MSTLRYVLKSEQGREVVLNDVSSIALTYPAGQAHAALSIIYRDGTAVVVRYYKRSQIDTAAQAFASIWELTERVRAREAETLAYHLREDGSVGGPIRSSPERL